MPKIEGCENHRICPRDWRETPDVTGCYELDAVIARSNNADVRNRLWFYSGKVNAYGPLTGYSAYENYHGDT